MVETTKISVREFLTALKRQGSISALLNMARQVDVSELSNEEAKDLAKGLRNFAGSKNGPMLIMGLPGPYQALLPTVAS